MSIGMMGKKLYQASPMTARPLLLIPVYCCQSNFPLI